MREFDVAVIGAGTGGSLAAAMLGRAGFRTCLIDSSIRPSTEFRCEKLEAAHVGALRRAGFLDRVLPAAERYDTIWIARQGRLAERRPRTEYGMSYGRLVDTLRGLVPESVTQLTDKVVGITPDAAGPTIALAEGPSVTARLVVLATGLNTSLFEDLGLERRVVSAGHSISAGFDVAPVGRAAFDFQSLTYFGENPRDRVSYVTFFPVEGHVRANLFVYRDKGDPWFGEFRAKPAETLHATLPRLKRLTGEFEVLDTPRLRPVDLVDTVGGPLPGVVLIGDAFSTACPVSGTGASKALVDAERLCGTYVPAWLKQGSITAQDVAAFYRDPEKVGSDQHSRELSLFAKRLALEPGAAWSAYRWLRFAGSATLSAASAMGRSRRARS